MPLSETRERIAANVRAEVARQRKTQAQLAGRLGITQQAMSRRLHGFTPFSVDELAIVADEVGVTVSSLIGESGRAA